MAINIADLFEHAVDVVPDRPVIQVGDRKVTYAQLEAEANRLAHFLAGFSVEMGARGLHFTGAAWPSLTTTVIIATVAAPLTAAVGLLAARLTRQTGEAVR